MRDCPVTEFVIAAFINIMVCATSLFCGLLTGSAIHYGTEYVSLLVYASLFSLFFVVSAGAYYTDLIVHRVRKGEWPKRSWWG